MPVSNAEITHVLTTYADLLAVENASNFRVRAYQNAARIISNMTQSISDMVRAGRDLSELYGIGKDLAGKIAEIARTSKLKELEALKKKLPAGLLELGELPGLGPSRISLLYRSLGVASIADLEKAVREGKLRQVPGFGEKTEQAVIREIERRTARGGELRRLKRSTIESLIQPMLDYLRKGKGVKRVEAVGSYRRGRETVGDLDLVATYEDGAEVIPYFLKYEDIERVVSQGASRTIAMLRFGSQVDLFTVPDESYGAALRAFTGSGSHEIAIRKLAIEKGLKINEYGVFRGTERIAGRTEEEVFKSIGLPFIPPELREDRGEIQAALEHRLPHLITLDALRGDLHVHTRASDGKSSLEDMVEAARKKNYEYIAITDHSKHLTIARGLTAERLAGEIEEIDRLNEKLKNFTVLKSIEVDIMEDGSLDLPDDILKRLDLVVGAVHHKFNLSQAKQTERIIKAMQNPYFTILAHPTGRMLGERQPYEVDMERIVRAARDTGCILELDAQPDRLDINDIHCRMAKEAGVLVAISTDAHHIAEMNFMRFGITQARRGWLEAKDVLNSRSVSELKKMLKEKKASISAG